MVEMKNSEEHELEAIKNLNTVSEIVEYIRNAEWARSVRESMAKGIEISAADSLTAKELAEQKATEVNTAIVEVNKSINASTTATNNAAKATIEAVTATKESVIATTDANSATVAANTAATNADLVRTDIETKLANGELKGEPGDITNAFATDIKTSDNKNVQLKINDFDSFMRDYKKNFYPIGYVLITYNNVNPTSTFGGTWTAFGKGRTLVGVDTTQTEFNTVGKTGGHKDMQKHTHLPIRTGTTEKQSSDSTISSRDTTGYPTEGNGGISQLQTAGTGDSGNLQPYITVYFWRRTA